MDGGSKHLSNLCPFYCIICNFKVKIIHDFPKTTLDI